MEINDILINWLGRPGRRRFLSPRLVMLLQAIFSVFLLSWIGKSLNVSTLREHFSSIDGSYVALGVAVMPLAVFMRVVRWHLLLDKMGMKVPLREVTALVWIGQALNAFMPSGTGEIAKGYFLKSHKGLWNPVIY